MTKRRRRVKQSESLRERLAESAKKFNEAAQREPPGSVSRELFMQRVRQAEAAYHINEWLRSPGSELPNEAKPVLAEKA
jgi:hypothetical protein